MPDRVDIERPPHFRETPEQRTEIEPTVDYPSAGEIEPYPEQPIELDEPLPVDTGATVPASEEPKDWSCSTVTVTDARHVQLAGVDNQRTRLFIRNNDAANAVFIGRGQTDPIFTMYQVEPGDFVELFHQRAVWAVCDSGLTAVVSVLQEFIPQD